MADVIELHRDTGDLSGWYSIVEYKRGKPKPDDGDEVQLCAGHLPGRNARYNAGLRLHVL